MLSMRSSLSSAALLVRQLARIALDQLRAGVGERVDGVPKAVDEAGLVEGLAADDLLEIARHLVVVGPVGHVGANVVDHLANLEVGAAVLGALERAQAAA
jgi:hypothetical protein